MFRCCLRFDHWLVPSKTVSRSILFCLPSSNNIHKLDSFVFNFPLMHANQSKQTFHSHANTPKSYTLKWYIFACQPIWSRIGAKKDHKKLCNFHRFSWRNLFQSIDYQSVMVLVYRRSFRWSLFQSQSSCLIKGNTLIRINNIHSHFRLNRRNCFVLLFVGVNIFVAIIKPANC